jgi:hypothetical protein
MRNTERLFEFSRYKDRGDNSLGVCYVCLGLKWWFVETGACPPFSVPPTKNKTPKTFDTS